MIESRTRQRKVRQRQSNWRTGHAPSKTIDDLGVDLLVLIARHVDAFMLPVLPFVSHRWRHAHDQLCRERDQRAAEVSEDGMVGIVHVAARKRATRYIKALIANGQPTLLAWACEGPYPLPLPKHACHSAALAGDLAVLDWVYQRQSALSRDFSFYAAASGSTAVIEWAAARGCNPSRWAWSGAALVGRMDMIEWLHARGESPRDPNAIAWATLYGSSHSAEPLGIGLGKLCSHLARVASRRTEDYERIIDWLLKHDSPQSMSIYNCAAMSGHLDLLQRLHDRIGYTQSDLPCNSAAYGGQLEVLRWLRQKGFYLTATAMVWAAKRGHLDVIRWLYANGCLPHTAVSALAAEGGHLSVLQWLHEHKIAFSDDICSKAARAGRIDMIGWLRACGHTWGASTCEAAARNGHLRLLQWLHREGCPWTEWACEGAALGGHISVLRWGHDQGLAWNRRRCADAAAWSGHLAVLQWIAAVTATDAPTDPSLWHESLCLAAATGGHLDVLSWLRYGRNCLWDKSACRAAAVDRERAHVVAWIDAQ